MKIEEFISQAALRSVEALYGKPSSTRLLPNR